MIPEFTPGLEHGLEHGFGARFWSTVLGTGWGIGVWGTVVEPSVVDGGMVLGDGGTVWGSGARFWARFWSPVQGACQREPACLPAASLLASPSSSILLLIPFSK